MAIEYKMDARGGFYAADPEKHIIEYAYPTSLHADGAKKYPEVTATDMLTGQSHVVVPFDEQPRWFKERWNYMRTQMLAAPGSATQVSL